MRHLYLQSLTKPGRPFARRSLSSAAALAPDRHRHGLLHRIVGAEHRNKQFTAHHQLAQPRLVGAGEAGIRSHQTLISERPQGPRLRPVRGMDLGAVEVAVRGMQRPAARPLDGDAGMARRMAGQGHQQDLRRQVVELRHRVEAEPAPAGRTVRHTVCQRAVSPHCAGR